MATYGPELITNGNFNTDLSSWLVNNNYWIWSGGRAFHQRSTDAGGELYQVISGGLDPQKWYELSFESEVTDSLFGFICYLCDPDGTERFKLLDLSGANYTSPPTVWTVQFRPPYYWSGDMGLVWQNSRQSGGYQLEMYLDNVSLKEIIPDTSNPDLPDDCTGTIIPPDDGGGSEYCPESTWEASTDGCGIAASATWADPCAEEEPL